MNTRIAATKNRTTFSISVWITLILVVAISLFGVFISIYVHSSLERDFTALQQQDFEHRITSYEKLINNYFNMHSRIINDISTQPIFSQTVMQPVDMKASITDHLKTIQVMGESVQLVLVDFEGNTIASSQTTPKFNYVGYKDFEPIIEGKAKDYFGIHKDANNNFYFRFATGIIYNQNTEGLLLSEVPIQSLATYYGWTTGIVSEEVKIFHEDDLLISVGPNLSDMPSISLNLPEKHLRLVGHLDNSGLVGMSHNLLTQFLVVILCLGLGTIIFILLLSKKLLIAPLFDLQKITDMIARGQFNRITRSAPEHMQLTKYRTKEIDTLNSHILSMAEMISVREKSLEEANATLEQRVNNRTYALRIARDEAMSANRAKSGFLATMSHEIRTPLNAILGILGLLQNTPLDEQQWKWVQIGRNSGSLLLTIINDILDFSKMEADKLVLEKSSFDLTRLFQQTIELIQHKADQKGLSIHFETVKPLEHMVKGDPDRLRQILLNLVNNAIKFTNEGSITVKLSSQSVNDSMLKINCTVADTGIGIPIQTQANLFDQFTMVDQSYSRNHEGTGLGLAICKKLTELMHGHISVISEIGKGSTFCFDVLLEPYSENEHNWQDPLIAKAKLCYPARGTRVLLAEDNPANQVVIKTILEYAGLQVDLVANGLEAVAAARDLSYDIVLMDISMPEMDGIEASKAIRKLPGKKAKIPIIALTAHALQGDREKFIQVGMNEHVTKPVDKALILDCIARWTSISNQYPNEEDSSDDIPEDTPIVDDVVDERVLQTLVRDTSKEIVPELIALYIKDANVRIDKIDEAIQINNRKQLAFETHTLGSSAAAHGNMTIFKKCREIETLCREGDSQQAFTQAELLVPEAKDALNQLEERAAKGFD